MIDLKLELQEYHIKDLKEFAQNECDIPDNIRNSVILYNKAIESLRTGSEDIAIIELKKALTMNPRFYEAMNLLGVCYGYIKDNVRAAEMFEKVIKAERNSVQALKYLNQLNSGDDPAQVKPKSGKKPMNGFIGNGNGSGKADSMQNNKKRTLWINFARFFSGIAVGALIFALVSMITFDSKDNTGIPASNDTVDKKTEKELQVYQSNYAELSGKYQLLQKDKDAAVQMVDYLKSEMKLYEIDSLIIKKQYESAADMLLLLKTVDFKDAEKVKFDGLYKSVMPQAAQVMYENGYNLYNTKKYEDSLKKLDKVQVYNPAFERMDAVLYYTGRCYQQLNDSRNAIATYQKLIDTFPNSSYTRNAKIRIKTLTELP